MAERYVLADMMRWMSIACMQ